MKLKNKRSTLLIVGLITATVYSNHGRESCGLAKLRPFFCFAHFDYCSSEKSVRRRQHPAVVAGLAISLK